MRRNADVANSARTALLRRNPEPVPLWHPAVSGTTVSSYLCREIYGKFAFPAASAAVDHLWIRRPRHGTATPRAYTCLRWASRFARRHFASSVRTLHLSRRSPSRLDTFTVQMVVSYLSFYFGSSQWFLVFASVFIYEFLFIFKN